MVHLDRSGKVQSTIPKPVKSKNLSETSTVLPENCFAGTMLDEELLVKVTEHAERVTLELPQDYQAQLDIREIFTPQKTLLINGTAHSHKQHNNDENKENVDGNSSSTNNNTNSISSPSNHTASPQHEPYGLIILNQDIDILPELFRKLWEKCHVRICADGGGNRLYEFDRSYVPDYIIGDFDSLRPEVAQHYASMGTVVIRQKTQLSSDLSKALSVMKLTFLNLLKDNYIDTTKENNGIEIFDGIHKLDEKHEADFLEKVPNFKVICLNGIGGRFDQTVQSIAHLYYDWLNVPSPTSNCGTCDPKMIFVTGSDIIIKVPKGPFYLKYDAEIKDKVLLNCGLLPLGNPTTVVKTVGFKWDVVDWETSVPKGRVSSSNRFSNTNGCYINVKEDLILNIEMNYEQLLHII